VTSKVLSLHVIFYLFLFVFLCFRLFVFSSFRGFIKVRCPLYGLFTLTRSPHAL